MKATNKFALVLVTAPDLKVARSLAQAALRARLVACASLVPKLESHYWWRGHIETSPEVLLLLKTSRAHLTALEKLILARHPYETPEFVVVNLDAGSPDYLQWIADSLK